MLARYVREILTESLSGREEPPTPEELKLAARGAFENTDASVDIFQTVLWLRAQRRLLVQYEVRLIYG